MDYTTYADLTAVGAESAFLAVIASMATALWIASAVIYVLLIIANWKIFTKAGERGWKSLIPIYNGMVLYKIIYGKMGYFFLLLIPVFGPIYGIISQFRLARVFGKGGGFGFGLWVLPNIFRLILAFSGSIQYVGPFGKQNAQ